MVSMAVSKIFLVAYGAPSYNDNRVLSTQPEADFVWRIVLMFGAVPAALTYYWRMKMPETARFTALVEGDHMKAAEDMMKVLETDIPMEKNGRGRNSHNSYGFFSREFVSRHGKHLIGTSTTWFLLDIAFYTGNLAQKDIFPSAGLVPKASAMNAIEEVFKMAKAMTLVALFGTVPGYWFTVFLIDKMGRFLIQLSGFLLMSVFMAILGFRYKILRGENCKSSNTGVCGGHPVEFMILYALTFFFANFGPNSTTFIVPAELFPARFRSTCHGISAASGKAGAILGAFLVQKYTFDGDTKKIQRSIIALAVVNFLGFLFTFLVPETKGKSLEEISGEDKDFGGRGEGAHGFHSDDMI